MANTRRASRKNRRNTRKNNVQAGGKIKAVGTKAEVFHGTAKHTSGGLHKKDLMKTKRGRIVSRRKHAAGQKAIKKLRKLGYVAKKGTFKLFSKKSKRGGSDAFADYKMMGGRRSEAMPAKAPEAPTSGFKNL
jgi:hypothetical protein